MSTADQSLPAAAQTCLDALGAYATFPGFPTCWDGSAAIPAEAPYSQLFVAQSPNVEYAGEWRFDGLLSSAPRGGNVTVRAAGSGVEFLGRGLARVFVDGTEQPADVTDTGARVAGLPYGWHAFTAEVAANGTFRSATPRADGQRWAVSFARDDTEVFRPVAGEGISDWSISTARPGSSIRLDVPKGSALLLITTDTPPLPFGTFNVTTTPPPPFVNASEWFRPSLQPAEQMAAPSIPSGLNTHMVPMYSVLLDPGQKYEAVVMQTGEGTIKMTNVHYYKSKGAAGRKSWSVLLGLLAVISATTLY